MTMSFSYEIDTIISEAVKHTKYKLYERLGLILKRIPVYIKVQTNFLDIKLSQIAQLPDELIEEAKQYDAEVTHLSNQIRYCRQTLTTLSYQCDTPEEFADALPDCILRNVLPVYRGLTRVNQPFEVCKDNAPMRNQIEKAVDILRGYQILKLIEGD